MRPTQRILVIDDEPDIGELIAHTAQTMGLQCTATTDPTTFLEAVGPDTTLIILDLMMPYIDGIELLRILAADKYKHGIVLMSGIDRRVIETAEQLATALGLCIVGRLKKPFGLSKLESVLAAYKETPTPSEPRPDLVVILDEHLRQAIQNTDFVLYYQPQIQIATRKVVGFEGLVRWLHPELGVVYPDLFIQRLETLDLIDQLGWIVLEKGISSWHSLVDLDGETPTLSLNVATHSLRDLSLPDRLEVILKKHNMPPGKLILEITESGVIDHLAESLDVLTRLRLKGVQLAIDDFGIGYSMLQQLRRIPATELKIDKSFIRDMLANYGDRIVVQKTIEIGHDLGMRLVAEGVETQEQLDYLSHHHCDTAQGYLIYKPHPLAVLLSWLQQYRVFSHRSAAPPMTQ
jgi:EAL domain-containing protein (putative c-di-GMP-specific phosphodiesterase class I)